MVVCRTSMTTRRRRSRRRETLRTTLAVVRFSAPGVLIAAGQLFAQRGDRLILGVFARPSDVGIYGVGATIADAAWVLPTAVSVIVLRQVARQGRLEALHFWRPRVLGATAAAAVGLASATSALVDPLLGARYHDVVPIVWILAGGSILFASQQIDSVAFTGLGLLTTSARISAAGALALAVLSVALIPSLHGIGAAIASVGAYGWMTIAARHAVRKLESKVNGRPPPKLQ
jgi:PST family polysaccharide transporter